jgi:hypothetical protein
MRTRLSPDSFVLTNETQEWATGLQRIGILNRLETPHFGRSAKINACVKLLLSFLHGGFLLLGRLMSIDTQLIMQITGFLLVGKDPLLFFVDKTREKALTKKMKEKYSTHKEAHGVGARL